MAKDKKPSNILNKKGIVTMTLAGVMAASPFVMAGCGKQGDKGESGASGKSAYELAVENGFQGTVQEWLDSLKGNTGKSVSDITSRYEYDYDENKEYYVFTILYSDGTTEERRVEIPQQVASIEYISATKYDMVAAGSEPALKINVTYSNGTTEEVTITDDMYVVDGTYAKPNFQTPGYYNVKIAYCGVPTTSTIRIVDPNAVQEFTVSADLYNNLQKFSHWEDSVGNIVSTDNVYTYEDVEEKVLTPVYEDFLEMTGRDFGTKGNIWNSNTNEISVNDSNGWYNMAYLTESLKKNMYIEFEIGKNTANKLDMFCYGISEKAYIEAFNNRESNGWHVSGGFKDLFAPEYGLYSGGDIAATKEDPSILIPNSNSNSAKTKYTNANIDFNNILKQKCNSNDRINIRLVLTDKIYMYIEGQLYTATGLPEVTVDAAKDYVFSFWVCKGAMQIVDFGMVETE